MTVFASSKTSAITRYLNEKLPGKSLVPGCAEERARMDMIMGLVNWSGYGALIGGVAAYRLFPEFVGGKNEEARQAGIEAGRKLLDFAMRTRGERRWIAGDLSLADLYLAPIMFYVSLTPDKDAVFDVPGFSDWWMRVGALPATSRPSRNSVSAAPSPRSTAPANRRAGAGSSSAACPHPPRAWRPDAGGSGRCGC